MDFFTMIYSLIKLTISTRIGTDMNINWVLINDLCDFDEKAEQFLCLSNNVHE